MSKFSELYGRNPVISVEMWSETRLLVEKYEELHDDCASEKVGRAPSKCPESH